VDGEHYDSQTKGSPVVSQMTVMIVLTLITMGRYVVKLKDVNGAFLLPDLKENERIYMEIPKGFERHYDPDKEVWLLLKTLYGLIQAAYAFWTLLVNAFKKIDYKRSCVDPCLFYRWKEGQLYIWMSWVDDLLACGPDQNKLKPELDAMDDQFECEDGGELKEYVGCKIEYDRKIPIMKLTQPVLIQSFEDEFEVNKLGRDVSTPAIPNTVIVTKAEKEGTEKDKTYMRSGVGKLLHLVRWSKPEIFNAVQELTRVISEAGAEHIKAMKRCMKYCVQTKERGRVIKPNMT